MFPTIKTLSDLVPHIENNPQIRVKVEPNGYTVVCYMLQDEDTFMSKNYQFARECRGITFAPDGKIAARTMHKFFNLGESEEVSAANLPWQDVVRVMDKRDGSMVTPVLMSPKTFKFKTKKSFDTPEAALADQLARETNIHLWILHLLQGGLTPTFEITSPRFPIVLLYEKDELTLLHVRENESGRYLTEQEIKFLNPPVPLVENVMHQFVDIFGVQVFSPEKIIKAAETATDIEGWIVQFKSGDMVKVKTKWYINLHHSVTFTRWRDVARAVIAGQSDDLKAAFAMTGRDIAAINLVESRIKHELEQIELDVQILTKLGQADGMDVKQMALKHKDNPYFGLIMRQFRGSSINWLEYYEKNYIDQWPLEVIPSDFGVNSVPPENLP